MGILKGTFWLTLKVLAAAIGAAAAVWLFSGFMVVETSGSMMLPELEPGQRVVASRMDTENLMPGDLVVYKAPYYHTGDQGLYLVRRVRGVRENMIEVTGGGLAWPETEIIEKDIILGKVITTWVKKNAN